MYERAQGIIFVLDSNDRDRVCEARDELHRMLNESTLRDACLLVYANNHDNQPNPMSSAEIAHKLGLHSLRQRDWYIQAACATTTDGLYEGLDWLVSDKRQAQCASFIAVHTLKWLYKPHGPMHLRSVRELGLVTCDL